MKHITASIIVLLILSNALLAQDMRSNISRSLFADEKANRLGDVITILVVETSSASNNAKTSTTRESDISLAGSGKVGTKPLPDAGFNIGTGNKFNGEGSTTSQGSVRAKITARIDSVLANGNLLINGSRIISVNGEEQVIKISGVVRPSDVQADNSVYSFNIADATIVFEGNGMIDRAQGPGWITKLFHWLF